MKTIRQFPTWFATQKLSGKIILVIIGMVLFCCLCSVSIAIFNPTTSTPKTQTTLIIINEPTSIESNSANTAIPPQVSQTDTPEPTNTPLPPTETPNPNLIKPGTYMVGVDIRPGIYQGNAGENILSSCYWGRFKDLSGDLNSILANDNSKGQFYVEVRDADFALETRCELVLIDSLAPNTNGFPQKLNTGTYLLGRDIQAGTYKGQAGNDITASCYWARLSNVAGGMDSIITNDNAIGQFYVQVKNSDFAFNTACEVERVGD